MAKAADGLPNEQIVQLGLMLELGLKLADRSPARALRLAEAMRLPEEDDPTIFGFERAFDPAFGALA